MAKAKPKAPSEWEDLYALYEETVREAQFIAQEFRRSFAALTALVLLCVAGAYAGLAMDTPFARWILLSAPVAALGLSVYGFAACRSYSAALQEQVARRTKLQYDLGLHATRGGAGRGQTWIETEPYATTEATYWAEAPAGVTTGGVPYAPGLQVRRARRHLREGRAERYLSAGLCFFAGAAAASSALCVLYILHALRVL